MKKKNSWKRILFLVLLLPVLLVLFAFALPAQYGKSYLAGLNGKAAALRETASPRIVLIGGSGAAFGFDCELLEEQLPAYRAVNFGLYAGLGTTVMLELALPDLREGDIVVFSPELSEQTLSDWFDPLSMWQAAEESPALLFRLDASRWGRMLAAFPSYAAQKARFFLTGSAPAGDGVYARASFTEKGDVSAALRIANQMPGGRDENMPLRFEDGLPDADWLRRFNDFTDACEKKGVSVFFRFCPMNAAALDAGETARMEPFTERLRAALHSGFLGSADRALMEPGWFFDTNFHLNGAGAVYNTVLLAEEIREVVGDPAPVPFNVPAMPALAKPVLQNGDNGDEDCFLYAAAEVGYIITGLSETGNSRTRLTVPVSHAGLPVLSFDRGTFAGNGVLEALILQSNLRSIPDGAFAGCASLKTVTLLQDDPGSCTVGAGLLTGTDAVVAVPKERYANYCTHYFWSVHAARLRPLEASDAPSPEPSTPIPTPEAATPVLNPAPSPAVKTATVLHYHGNGGQLRSGSGDALTREITFVHRRENTLPGTVWFERTGSVLTGWNTAPDGSGISVGLGSRYDPRQGSDLYAQWLPCTEDGDFDWETDGKTAAVTGYHGDSDTCVLPPEHDGLPVRVIRSGAFQNQRFTTLMLSPALRTMEENAFTGCGLETVILFDSLETVSDACFSGCSGPVSLRVNAATAPAYSGSYFDTFQDKYDYLLSLEGKPKLVLSSGSSGRYGYDSPRLKTAFPAYEPVNMGVYAYTGALPQLALILPRMDAGDILLYAPEFDAIQEQFCVTNLLDTGFWAMMESNYDAAAELDMRAFSGVFDSFGEYLRIRAKMPKKSYTDSPARHDDDGNDYGFSTYNAYGDFILPRPNGDTDERLRHNIADYTVNSFPPETVQSLNAALAPFTDKGVTVWFTYTPRNVNSLTEESTPEARERLHRWLKESLTVPVISNIEDTLLPGRYFWRIDSHTGTEGAAIRTERVIQDLQTAWENGL